LHLEQISPGLISAIVLPVASKSTSSVFDMGFPLNHASLLNVALPSCDSSGVYAIGFHLLSLLGCCVFPYVWKGYPSTVLFSLIDTFTGRIEENS
jgi:hypothetical protein